MHKGPFIRYAPHQRTPLPVLPSSTPHQGCLRYESTCLQFVLFQYSSPFWIQLFLYWIFLYIGSLSILYLFQFWISFCIWSLLHLISFLPICNYLPSFSVCRLLDPIFVPLHNGFSTRNFSTTPASEPTCVRSISAIGLITKILMISPNVVCYSCAHHGLLIMFSVRQTKHFCRSSSHHGFIAFALIPAGACCSPSGLFSRTYNSCSFFICGCVFYCRCVGGFEMY